MKKIKRIFEWIFSVIVLLTIIGALCVLLVNIVPSWFDYSPSSEERMYNSMSREEQKEWSERINYGRDLLDEYR